MYIYQFCHKCGKRFCNPAEDDYADLCETCRDSTQVTNEINDKFTPEELQKIAMGPNNQLEPDTELDISDMDDTDIDDDEGDYQEFDEFEEDFDDDFDE